MPRFGLSLPAWRLRFERQGWQLHIRLQREAPGAAQPAFDAARPKPKAHPPRRDPRSGPMQAELSEMLHRHPDARAVLRHLAMFEKILRKKGDRAFTEPPVELLRGALLQLDGLVTDWSPKGLAELRSRLAVTVMERESRPERRPDVPIRSNFLDEHKLEVSEASAADFEKAQTDWGGLDLSPR